MDRDKKVCGNCAYYKPDYGIWCVNGWSGDGSTGKCVFEWPRHFTGKDDTCHNFSNKLSTEDVKR